MDLPIVIILAVVCMAIGFVLALLIGALRGERAPGTAAPRTAAPEAVEPPAVEGVSGGESAVSGAPGARSAGTAETSETGWVSVLHVGRDPHSGALVVATGGKLARSAQDLDREALAGATAAHQELGRWLGLPERAGAPGTAAPRTAAPIDLLEDAQATAAGKPARPSLNPINVISNALRSEVRRPADWSERSLAAQVDEVLQEKLQGTPLARRGIRLLDGPDQGVWVQVGMEKYSGVEQVPEAEIRALIGEAAAEWRRLTEGGQKGAVRRA